MWRVSWRASWEGNVRTKINMENTGNVLGRLGP
jgi:hypothetical protein